MTLTGFRAWAVLVVMILSLCLNSFFIGAIVTRNAGGGGSGAAPGREMVAIAGFQRLLQGLPEATRVYLREAFDAQSATIVPEFRGLRDARRDVLDAIVEPGFSPDALATALGAVRQQTTVLQQTLHRVFVETVAGMPAGMRDEMVEIWRSRQ